MVEKSIKSRSKSKLFEDSSGNTIEDYPSELENLYLLGVDESGAWYFNPMGKSVHNYILEQEPDKSYSNLELEFSMNEEEISNAFEDISSIAEDLIDRTAVGHALVMSKLLSEETHLTAKRAKVYAFRDIFDVGRNQTSRILNKSPNTIDNQRARAREQAEKARRFVEISDQYE